MGRTRSVSAWAGSATAKPASAEKAKSRRSIAFPTVRTSSVCGPDEYFEQRQKTGSVPATSFLAVFAPSHSRLSRASSGHIRSRNLGAWRLDTTNSRPSTRRRGWIGTVERDRVRVPISLGYCADRSDPRSAAKKRGRASDRTFSQPLGNGRPARTRDAYESGSSSCWLHPLRRS